MATITEPHIEKTNLGTTGGSNPLDSMVAVRTIAMNAGDLSLSVMQEVTRIMAQEGNSQAKSIQTGIERLLKSGYISAKEAQDLKKVSNLVLGGTRAKSDVAQAAAQVRELYHGMVITGTSNPVALAIASAANASLSASQKNGTSAGTAVAAVTITPGSAGAGAVIGGIIGGVIGGVVGGGLGAGLGAAIGAAAGGAIGFCNRAGV